MRYFLVIFLVLVLAQVGFGTIINVPNDQPTIQDGVNAAISGDTVLVEPNTYYEHISISNKEIILISQYAYSGDYDDVLNTIIDGGGTDRVLELNYISGKVQGFTIRNGYQSAVIGGGIKVLQSPGSTGDSLVICDNYIYNNESRGVFSWNSEALYRNNMFMNNTAIHGGAGLICYDYDSSIIINNIFRDNTSDQDGGAISCTAWSRDSIANNTIFNNTATDGAGIRFANESELILENNIIVQNFGGGIQNVSGSATLICNNVWDNQDGDYNGLTADPTDISADPRFCDTTVNDFGIYNTSPCAPANNSCGELIGAKEVNCDFEITISSLEDSGPGTLREAITTANTSPGPDSITFTVSGSINLGTPLPAFTSDSTFIMGATAPGGAHSIIIDGTGLGAEIGLVVNSDYNIISGLTVINWEGPGIEVTGNHNTVENCHVNVNADGDTRQAGGGHGINISGDYNMVGGPDEMYRNIIACSDNKNGINISLGNFNDVMGNYIGLSASGGALNELPAGNTNGVRVSGGYNNIGEITALGNYIVGVSTSVFIFDGLNNQVSNNYLGLATNLIDTIPNNVGIIFNGTCKHNTIGPDNVIAKCGSSGIYMSIGCDSNIVRGNTLIGGAGSGIMLTSGPLYNLIGGSNPEDGNIISFNAQDGITLYGGTNDNLVRRNTIYSNTQNGIKIEFNCANNLVEQNSIYENGRDGIAVSINSLYNSISENLIYQNGEIGIDLNIDGVTPNDSGDVDTGPNDLLNFPVKDSAFSQEDGSYNIYGQATPSSTVELFVAHPANDATRPEDVTGYGEAYSYIGSTVADPSGDFIAQNIAIDHFSVITTTATDLSGNTSEFGANFMLIPSPLTVVAYSPVNIIIQDPDGFQFGKDADGVLIDEISPAEYHDLPNDSVIISQPILGDYIIYFVTESGADPNSTYSAIIKVNGTLAVMIVIGAQVPDAGIANSYTYTFGERGYYENGDSNGDGSINLGDAGFIVNYIFYEGPAPEPLLSGDANCDMTVNLADAGYIINYIFYDGSPPCYFAP